MSQIAGNSRVDSEAEQQDQRRSCFRASLRAAAARQQRSAAQPLYETPPAGRASVAENFDLLAGADNLRQLPLQQRTRAFWRRMQRRASGTERPLERRIVSATDREVWVETERDTAARPMLMFGSNNYLGFANHPYVKQQVTEAVARWGVGAGGPPAINGYGELYRQVEARIAALKGTEDAILFSSGYAANLALATALARPQDLVVSDALVHASFVDGLAMHGLTPRAFPHNDMASLEEILRVPRAEGGQTYVAVEGVYSMEGDIAPLDRVVALCKRYGAISLLDDAHGTGVLGPSGAGTAEHHGVHGEIDVTMGTFSKVFGVTGGFIGGSRELIRYLRFAARSYVFSAALPPTVLSAVLAGLDLLEREPQQRERLFDNVRYAAGRLRRLGHEVGDQTPILVLHAPEEMDIDRGCSLYHEAGIFVGAIEYPAVPRNGQRYRISITADHTRSDLDRLCDATASVWADQYEGRAS